MATKQIPFSLEMVKKIQAGEVKGIIKTRDGRAARFICEVCNDTYPLVFVCEVDNDSYRKECAYNYAINGFYFWEEYEDDRDIILEIETNEKEKPEHQFKPFDKVLVRDLENEEWKADFFSRYYTDYRYDYECVSGAYIQCIPYEGNEQLLGTTNKQKED